MGALTAVAETVLTRIIPVSSTPMPTSMYPPGSNQRTELRQCLTDLDRTALPPMQMLLEAPPYYGGESLGRGIPVSWSGPQFRATPAARMQEPREYMYPSNSYSRPLLSAEVESPEGSGSALVDQEANNIQDNLSEIYNGIRMRPRLSASLISHQPTPTTTRLETLKLTLQRMGRVQTSQGHSTAIKCVKSPCIWYSDILVRLVTYNSIPMATCWQPAGGTIKRFSGGSQDWKARRQ